MSHRGHDAESVKSAAEHYERYFVPAIGAPVAEDLIEAASLRPGERVLDVACGTGIVTRLAAKQVGAEGTVLGSDPNPGMVAVARETAPPGAMIEWHQAPAEEMPLPDDSFDVVLCGMGLQFFSDRLAGLGEMRRVLVPGGRLVANLPGPTPPPFEIMAEALARHIGPESASFVHAVFSLHDADELRSLATDAGFEHVDVRSAAKALELPAPGDFLWQYVRSTPLAAPVTKVAESRRSALEQEFSRRCQDLVQDGGLRGQVRMTTVVATK